MTVSPAYPPPLLADTLEAGFERGLDSDVLGRELRANQPVPLHRVLSKSDRDGVYCERVLIRSDVLDGSDVFISAWLATPHSLAAGGSGWLHPWLARGRALWRRLLRFGAPAMVPPLPPILVIPGGRGEAKQSTVKFAARLCNAVVLGVDWIGRGESSRVRGLDPSPQGNALLFDGEDYRDSYQFHNLRGLLAALNFLLSLPGVDAAQTTVVGGSWGGFYTWNLASLDSRIRNIFPTFGCGFLDLETRYVWEQAFREMGAPRARTWLEAFDPGRRVERITARVFYESATNDKFYSIPSAMLTYRRVRAQKHLLLVHNQDHFMKPYKQAYHVVRHLLGDSAAVPPPVIASVDWDPEGPALLVRTDPPEDVRVWVAYSGGRYTRSFGRFWRRVPAERTDDAWRAALPVVDPDREIWFYAHAERTDALLGGSSEVYRVVPREHGVRMPNAEFEPVFHIPDLPEWELPVGDRLNPATEVTATREGPALTFRFLGGEWAKGVLYCLEGDLIARGGYDVLRVRLGVPDPASLETLMLLLVTDYHAGSEQTYGVPLREWMPPASGGEFVDVSIPFAQFQPVRTRRDFWGQGGFAPLEIERLCGMGLYHAGIGGSGEVLVRSAGVARGDSR